jgi:putative membrane protein
MKTALRWCLLTLGLAVFASFLARAGVGEILRTVGDLGWLAPLVLVPYLLVYVADASGWWSAFGPEGPGVGWLGCFRIRWAGEAVNNVVPTAYVGGEAVKVYLLHKRGLPLARATAGSVISKSVQTLAQLLFISSAALVFYRIGPAEGGFRAGMLGVMLGGLTVVVGLFWLQRRGLFDSLSRALATLRIRPAALERRREALSRVDRAIGAFYLHHRGHFLRCLGAHLGGWLLDPLEIFLVAQLLHFPITWWQALAVEAFVSVAKILGLFVPGALGIQESGIVFLCRAAGLEDAFGLAYALIRRGREVAFALVGWFLLYVEEGTWRGLAKRVAAGTRM